MISNQDSSVAQRYKQMQDWLHQKAACVFKCVSIVPLAGDASCRRYFRVFGTEGQSYIVMDAPPDKENTQKFVDIALLFQKNAVRTPTVLVQDIEHGFLLLSDVGDRLYGDALDLANESQAGQLYCQALEVLLKIQRTPSTALLRPYSYRMYREELQLFLDWYLSSTPAVRWLEDDLFPLLIDNALTQPQVCVHRDYHSRNIMLDPADTLVVLDFQDAVWGPITYDVVSLLKDCYRVLEPSQVTRWLEVYCQQQDQYQGPITVQQWRRWFDLMGLQRHLKCLGIFVRLYKRDQKARYLTDIPRVLAYVKQVAEQYPECAPLLSLL